MSRLACLVVLLPLLARAATAQPATQPATQSAAQPAALAGRVLDARTETPVAEAVVELPALGLATRADSTGAVRLARVPPGTHRVRVRAVGYQAVDALLRFLPTQTVESDFLLAPVAPRLSAVRVEERYTALDRRRLLEFEERRKIGMGKFLDAEHFERNPGQSVGSLIAGRIPGLTSRGVGSREHLRYTGRGNGGVGCIPRMIVNGLPMDPAVFSVGSLQASEVLGFEFYTPSTVPAQYNIAGDRRGASGSECATAIIWTR